MTNSERGQLASNSDHYLSQNYSASDHAFMSEALQLAKKGLYTTDPNPRVGCVIVREGEVVGRGWHRKAGCGHAEVNALADAGEKSKGATAYVTLEPCSHFGRTPPCANALIDAGISSVIAAMRDPNPSVAGRGFDMLASAGISVKYGLLEDQAQELNAGFVMRMESGRPFVRIKMAISVDGRTAMQSGESQWITGPAARSDVQRLRARSSAIITGIGTVLHDDAALTVRAEELGLDLLSFDNAGSERKIDNDFLDDIVSNQPLRVVMDMQAQLPASAKLLSSNSAVLWVVSDDVVLNEFQQKVADLDHVELFAVPKIATDLVEQGVTDRRSADNCQELNMVLSKLTELGCNELLVEAGAKLAGSFIQAGCFDELVVYMAPKLMGSDARPLVDFPIESMSEAQSLVLKDMRVVGDDVRFIYSPVNISD